MKHLISLLLCVCLSVSLCAQNKSKKKEKKAPRQPKVENLLSNGGFEKGKGDRTPDGWAKFDGLTVQWTKNDGHPGRCVLFDTTVLQIDKRLLQEAEDKFKAQGHRQGARNQYDTVGAHEGVWTFAQPYDIQPGDEYFILSADVASDQPSSELFLPMVFIRGFQKVTAEKAGQDSSWFHEHFQDGVGYSEMFGPKTLYRASKEGDWLMVYRHTMSCRVVELNAFRHFELGFKLPSIKKFRPERLLIKPYAFWPAGHYRFDNICLRRATKAEADAANARRPSIKEVLP